jgi:hypothetical protein
MTDFSLLAVAPEHYVGMQYGGHCPDPNHPAVHAKIVSSQMRANANNRLERNKRLLERLLRAQVRIAEANAEIADPIYGAKMAAKRKRKQDKIEAAQRQAERKQKFWDENRFEQSSNRYAEDGD